MKYDLKKEGTGDKARAYLDKLIENKSKCEVKKINPNRSISQNAYLHKLIALWGNEFGYFMEEAKQEIKEAIGYTYTKQVVDPATGEVVTRKYLSETHKMDSRELTIFIDKFRDYSSAACGLYLPTSKEFLEEREYFDNEAN